MSGDDELDEAVALANAGTASPSRSPSGTGDSGRGSPPDEDDLTPPWPPGDRDRAAGRRSPGTASSPPVPPPPDPPAAPCEDDPLIPGWLEAEPDPPAVARPSRIVRPVRPVRSAQAEHADRPRGSGRSGGAGGSGSEAGVAEDGLMPGWMTTDGGTGYGAGTGNRGEPSDGEPGEAQRPGGKRMEDGLSPEESGGTEARPARDGSRHRAAAAADGHVPAHPHREVSWDEAQRIAARAVVPAPPVTVPLDEALRQVLAAPVEALADLPSFDTSAMDGWAVAGPGPWKAQERGGILAGQGEREPLADGHAVRIATGARIPYGATAVLRNERARERDGRLRLAPGAPAHSAAQGTDIRPRGQECRSGDRLLPAGTPVTPPVLGLAAAAGYDRLTVTPRPRAEVLVLGDELLHRGLPGGGRIRDALGPMVGPWLTALGADTLVTRRLGDDAEALYEAVATSTADLLVTTGGTAHGPVDHVRPTLRRLGARPLVDGVEVRPGHPMLLAGPAGEGAPYLVGLPGNPLAAVSGLLTLAAPLIRGLAGRPEPAAVQVTLTAEVHGHPRDTRLVPVTLPHGPSGPGAAPLHFAGPAMLRGVAGADALVAVPPGGAPAGTSVRLVELPW